MIEFDLDLWNTGEYDLFNRRGEKFSNLECEVTGHPIYPLSWYLKHNMYIFRTTKMNGSYFSAGTSEHDFVLKKKESQNHLFDPLLNYFMYV